MIKTVKECTEEYLVRTPSYLEDYHIEEDNKREGVINSDGPRYIPDCTGPDELGYQLHRISNCGETKFPYTDKKTGESKVLTIRCHSPYCPRCGGEGGYLHHKRVHKVTKRLDGKEISAFRFIVYTIPENLVHHFFTKEMLDRLLSLVKRAVERVFGVKTPKGPRIYKPVLATLELFGDNQRYNPHVNVLIFEDNIIRSALKLSPEKLTYLKATYKRALEKLLHETIPVINVYYRYEHEK